MKLYKTEALVLRAREYQDADRLLTLLTWERGKIGAIARGARKTKSKLAAGVELFTYGNFLLYLGKNLDTVTQVEPVRQFHRLRADLEAYGCALYMAEMVDRFVEEAEPCALLCRMLLAAWQVLEEGSINKRLLLAAFQIKLLAISGYRPHFSGCVRCGRNATSYRFYPSEGGILCPACAGSCSGPSLPCSHATAALAVYLLKARFPQLNSERKELEQLEQVLDRFTAEHTGGYNFKSRLFLQKIAAFGEDKK